MSVLYIGIAGVSRSGKDSLALEIENLIKSYKGKIIYRTSLAQPLKEDCKDFIKQYLHLDVFTDKTEEKSIFREFLVWYGKVKRQQTEGKYWTNLLDERVNKFQPDICIVPDVRYQQYEQDEVSWLKSKPNNILIHLQRIAMNGEVVQPANMDESINDSIIQNSADYKIVWPTFCEEKKEKSMIEVAQQVFNAVIKEKI
jgi:ABC-type oligopeptide transport system ATPase subunit